MYQTGRTVYEKTPTYYRVPKVPKRIKDMDPEMKIIFIVCDNSRRALSRYFHLANMGMRHIVYDLFLICFPF